MTVAEIDFGSTPTNRGTFTITDAAVTALSYVVVQPSSIPATGRVGNDFEFDVVQFTATPAAGSFNLFANVANGHVVGKRNVLYLRES